MRRILLIGPYLLLTALLLAAVPARAACELPAGNEKDIIYNNDYHTYEYCDGLNWVSWAQNPAYNPTGSGGTAWDPSNKDASITLSNGNLTATGSLTFSWKSVISAGSGKSSGKWYWRCKAQPIGGGYATCGISTKTEPTSDLVGADANGWLFYVQPGNVAGVWHSGGYIGPCSFYVAAGDYIVVAFDAGNAKIWCTTMTASGTLSTNWDNAYNNPSTNTGGYATGGLTLQPATSIREREPRGLPGV